MDADALTPEEAAYFENQGEMPEDTATEDSVTDTKDLETETEQQEEGNREKVSAEEGQPEPEGDKDQVEETEQPDKPTKMVPHGALHAEREEHKKTRSEAGEWREKAIRAEERLNFLMQSVQQQQQQAEEPEPDPNEDFIKYTQYWAQKTEKARDEHLQLIQAERARAEAEQQSRILENTWTQAADSFRQTSPDFDKAIEHLANARAQELSMLGYNRQQINEQMSNELGSIVVHGYQSGTNPAEIAYKLAQQRGYKQVQPQIKENIQKTQEAIQASKTLASTGGNAPQETTMESLASMSDAEFSDWYSKNGKKFEAMFGG